MAGTPLPAGRAAHPGSLPGRMKLPRMLIAASLALVAALSAPAAASAACAAVPLKDLIKVDVVATVKFEDGDVDAAGILKSPAIATVRDYDRGSGPDQLKVSTSVGTSFFGAEGISPKPGEVWRLYGAKSGGGQLGTSVCAGSVLLSPQSASARVVAGKTKTLAPASIGGEVHIGTLPAVKLPRSGNLTVRAASPSLDAPAAQGAAVLLIEPGHPARALKVAWSGRSGASTGKLTKLRVGKKGGTLVVVTREASFAIALRPAA